MTKKILLIGGICLALAVGAVVCLFVAFFVSMERGEKHQRQIREEQRSGKWDFGDQPALFAVAQAIVKNDQDAIRAAAKALPNLQTLGRDGTTLLYFAVTHSMSFDSRSLHLKLARCPRSLAPPLVALTSMSLIPPAPFNEAGARNGPILARCCAHEHVKRAIFAPL